MMGMKQCSFAPLVNVSLEELVPHDHFYRHLERTLDLSFVREFVQETYAGAGRPSIDPVVFFKLQLVMFFEGIRSERLLMRHADDRLSVRWYLGYDLDEPLPDHSSLTRIRTRYGVEMFRRFFEAIVDQCQQAGLVWGKELYVDATKVNANASMESVKPRFAVEEHLRELFATEGKKEPERAANAEPCPTASEDGASLPEAIREETTSPSQAPVPPTPVCEPTVTASVPLPVSLDDATQQDLIRTNEQRHDWIEQVGKPNREVIRGTYRRMADFVVSTTDPDATVMPTKGEGRHLGYHTHYVVDGGKARIIMAVLVTPSEVMENQPMLDLVFRTRFRWKLWPHQATGDTTYGTVDNIVALEYEHIHAYVPLPDFDQRTPFYGRREFQYDPEQDAYTCPHGAKLPLKKHHYTEREKEYRADAAICNACPLKEHCTLSEHGRSLRRSFDEEYLDRVRAYHMTEPYQKAMRKRSVWVEPLFAEGKEWHGMRRFRLRRLWRVNCEALMRAAGQNLKRLLKKRGWGRRPWPEGAANALAEPPSQDRISLHTPSVAEKALACGENLQVKDFLKSLLVLSIPFVFAPSPAHRWVSSSREAILPFLVLFGFPQLVCGSLDASLGEKAGYRRWKRVVLFLVLKTFSREFFNRLDPLYLPPIPSLRSISPFGGSL
jgi:transposase